MNIKKEIIYKENRLKEVLKIAKTKPEFSFDIETSPKEGFKDEKYAALDPHKSVISTISFAFEEDKGYVVPLQHKKGENINIPTDKFYEMLKPIFLNDNIIKIAFNFIFESKHQLKYNCFYKNVSDPMLMAIRTLQITDPGELNLYYLPKGLGLKDQSKKYLNYKMDNFQETIGDLDGFGDLDIEDGAKYSVEDSVIALKLFKKWKKELENIDIPEKCNGRDIGKRPFKNYWEFHNQLEAPTLLSIGFMEYQGLYFDKPHSEIRKKEASAEVLKAKSKLKSIARKHGIKKITPGKTGKTKAVRQLLFNTLDCPIAKSSKKTGKPSLDAESVSDIKYMIENKLDKPNEIYCKDEYKKVKSRVGDLHKNSEDILDVLDAVETIQKMGTLVGTHIEGRSKYLNPVTKRIHSEYNIYPRTSRFASSKPNAQNIPNKENDDLQIRSLYAPEKDNILVLIDYAGQEARISGEMYKDKTMIDIIKHGWDMHSFTAKAIFDLDVDLTDGSRVEKKYRTPAKPAFFTMMYGGGGSALQKNYKGWGIYKSKKECNEIIDKIKSGYPGLLEFEKDVVKFAEKNGYAETMLGYKRLLPDIKNRNKWKKYSAQRAALNTPIQGTAADVTKTAMNNIYNCYVSGKLDPKEIKLVATIHDELAFEIKKMNIEKIDSIVKILKEQMEKKMFEDQLLQHLAEPEIADPHDIFGIGESNGWAEKYDYYDWREKVCSKST